MASEREQTMAEVIAKIDAMYATFSSDAALAQIARVHGPGDALLAQHVTRITLRTLRKELCGDAGPL